MSWGIVFAMFFVTLLSTLGGLAFLYLRTRKLHGNAASSSADEIKQGLEDLTTLDDALKNGIEKFSMLVPLGEAKQLRERTQAVAADIEKDNAEFVELEKTLEELQREVSQKEQALLSIRQTQEATQTFVKELKGKSVELRAKNNQIGKDLNDSAEQLSSLSSEAKITAQQQAALAEVEATMQMLIKQISALSDVHTNALDRLLNLDNQYKSLEEEYEKIVALELSGAN